MKKGEFAVIVILALLAAASFSVYADIYLGTVEGYAKDTAGAIVSGATISAAVQGCSSGGCSASSASDSGGYFVIGNLNMPAFGIVSVSATKGLASGSATAIADAYQAAAANVTLCTPPSAPTLTPVSDRHSQSASFAWSSGTGAVYDEFKIDSGAASPLVSPQTRTGLSFATHTWYARSCNNYCCSAWQQDSFDVYNTAPSSPTLTAEPDTNGTAVELVWSSGTDTELDSIYSQYQFNSGTIINATSPVNETGLTVGNYLWRVRTCDSFGYCSSWVEDSFIVAGCAAVTTCTGGGGGGHCPDCPSCDGGSGGSGGSGGAGGGGGGETPCPGSYKLAIIAPAEVRAGGTFNFDVSFESSISLEKVKFTADGPTGINVPAQNIKSVPANDAVDFEMKGAVAASVNAGEYELILNGYVDNALTITQKFKLNVAANKPLIEMPSQLPTENNLDSVGSIRKKLAKGDRLPFISKQGEHVIFVTDITDSSAQLTIYSEPVSLLINAGESKDVDLTGDNIADINIKLNAITDSTADLTVTELKPLPAKELLLISAGVFLTLLVIVLIVIYRLHAREKAKSLFRQIRAIERGK